MTVEMKLVGILIQQSGVDPGGGGGGGPPAPAPQKWEKIWFFTRNSPKTFAPPSARCNFFNCAPPPNLKSWICPCRGIDYAASFYDFFYCTLELLRQCDIVCFSFNFIMSICRVIFYQSFSYCYNNNVTIFIHIKYVSLAYSMVLKTLFFLIYHR